MYHTCALDDARDVVRSSIAERDRVGRYEGPRPRPTCEAVVERVARERTVRAGRREDFGDRERLSDHARRHDERFWGR